MKLRILWFGPLPVALVAEKLHSASELQITYLRTKSSDQQFDQLLDGSVDAVITAIDNVVAWNQRAPATNFRAIAQMEKTTELTVFGRAGVRSLASLRGSRLLVDAPANGFVVALRALLDQAGVDSGGCELVPAGGVTERLQALLAGHGDATLLGAPFDEVAAGAGCQALARINDVFPKFPGQGLVIATDRYKALAPALSSWLSEMTAARAWIASKQHEAIALLASTGLSQSFANRSVALIPSTWRPDVAGVELLIQHRGTVGLDGAHLGYCDLVDTSLLDQRTGSVVSPPAKYGET